MPLISRPPLKLSLARSHVVTVDSFPALLAVRRHGFNLAIWERTVAAALHTYLDQVPADRLPNVSFDCRGPQVVVAIREELEPWANDHPAWALLVDDLIDLVTAYATHVDGGRLSVRIERVDTDLCTKYHCDATGIRLLSTYCGPGTCWVPNAAVARDQIGPHGDNTTIVSEPALVRQLPRYAVGLLKGEQHGDHSDPAVVHRSPPLHGTGQVRLLLCVEPWRLGHGD